MRSFETRGPVYPEDNYVLARTDELSDFINWTTRARQSIRPDSYGGDGDSEKRAYHNGTLFKSTQTVPS